jgi:hypothetical protein
MYTPLTAVMKRAEAKLANIAADMRVLEMTVLQLLPGDKTNPHKAY